MSGAESRPAGDARLEWFAERAAAHGGAVPFEEFMGAALGHPEFGYYTRHIRGVGRRGDFATSASRDNSLGRAIARWVKSHRMRGWKQHLIEIGAGSGQLAKDILRALGPWGRATTSYHIVETSPVLRDAQRSLLGRGAIHHADMASALAACGGRALIFSNELVDAFPCVLLEKKQGVWGEIFLRLEGGAIREESRAPRDKEGLPESDSFAEGQRIEIHRSYRDWLRGWLPHWMEGRSLTIDYGDTFPSLYHRRPRGTVRAYSHHERLEGPEVYRRFGRQDLTADVNFSDLARWGEAAGLAGTTLVSQADFLAGMAIGGPMADPGGTGGAFRVLEQVRRSADAST